MSTEQAEILVVGAGIAGLAAAGHLTHLGHRVVVIDRGRKPGGRCASRRLDGEVFDYGPVFGHGQDPAFLAAVREAVGYDPPRWPRQRVGAGTPCNLEAWDHGAARFYLPGGLNTLAAGLARGLDVRTEVQASAVGRDGARIVVTTNRGGFAAPTVVLALPPPQALPLVAGMEDRGVAPIVGLFRMLPYVPTLCVAVQVPIAGDPPFDLCLPELPSFVHLIALDSSKRSDAERRTFVVQARPAWSRQHLDDAPEVWSAALLAEASAHWPQLGGPPLAVSTHRWRYARPAGPGVRGPVVLDLGGGTRLGFASDAMDPAGGLEGAWRAGRRLADLIDSKEHPT